mgnify:CR=1 FL=1
MMPTGQRPHEGLLQEGNGFFPVKFFIFRGHSCPKTCFRDLRLCQLDQCNAVLGGNLALTAFPGMEIVAHNLARGEFHLSSAMYYNDQPPQMMYYAALTLKALGEDTEAQRRFGALKYSTLNN